MSDVPSGERGQLQDTAVNLARWQGMVDATLAEIRVRMDKQNGLLASIEEDVSTIRIDLSVLKTRYGMATGLAGALFTVVVGLVVKAVGG